MFRKKTLGWRACESLFKKFSAKTVTTLLVFFSIHDCMLKYWSHKEKWPLKDNLLFSDLRHTINKTAERIFPGHSGNSLNWDNATFSLTEQNYFHSIESDILPCKARNEFLQYMLLLWRQRGQVVRAPDLKSGGRGLKSLSDHLAGVVSRWTLVQLLGHACI